MDNNKNEITVTIKLYAGIDKDISVSSYDPGKGIVLSVKKGTRLKKILKNIGISKPGSNIYFVNGKKIGLWKKFKSSEEIACLKPAAGG